MANIESVNPKFGRKGDAAVSNPEDEERRLFVGGLSWATTEKQVEDYFGKFGAIEDLIIKKDENGQPRGFAFVLYKDKASIDVVLQAGQHQLGGRTVNPKRVRPQEQVKQSHNCKIYVRNSKDATIEQIKEYFGKYGVISNSDFPMYNNPDGSTTRREYCFLEYELPESAEVACQKSFHTIGSCSVEARRFANKEAGRASRGGTRGMRVGGGGRGGAVFHPYPAQMGYGGVQPGYQQAVLGGYGQWSGAATAAAGSTPGYYGGGASASQVAPPYTGSASAASGYYGNYYGSYGGGAAPGYPSAYGVPASSGGYGAGAYAAGAYTGYGATSSPSGYYKQ